MGTSTTEHALKLVNAQSKPLVIHSIGGQLSGSLNLHNASDTKVRLKSMPIDAPDLKAFNHEPLSHAQLRGKLYPDERGEITFNIPIDPSTPPGSYKASIKIGETTQNIVLEVEEHFELEAQPDSIVLRVEKTDQLQQDKNFKFTNLGNKDITIAGTWPFSLQSLQDMNAILLNMLQRSCNDDDADTTIDLICKMANKYPKQGNIDFGAGSTIKAGQTVGIKGKITLPDDMQSNMHYFATLDLFTANIVMDIYSLS